MSEKISEKHIRQEKINKIKEIGLKEIQQYKEKYFKEVVSLYYSDYDKKIEELDYFNKIYHQVLLLESCLKTKDFLMDYLNKYPEYDKINYVVSINDIDMWLEAGVLDHYLVVMERNHYDYILSLPDRHFSSIYNNFFSVFEKIIYDEKHKND